MFSKFCGTLQKPMFSEVNIANFQADSLIHDSTCTLLKSKSVFPISTPIQRCFRLVKITPPYYCQSFHLLHLNFPPSCYHYFHNMYSFYHHSIMPFPSVTILSDYKRRLCVKSLIKSY